MPKVQAKNAQTARPNAQHPSKGVPAIPKAVYNKQQIHLASRVKLQ